MGSKGEKRAGAAAKHIGAKATQRNALRLARFVRSNSTQNREERGRYLGHPLLVLDATFLVVIHKSYKREKYFGDCLQH